MAKATNKLDATIPNLFPNCLNKTKEVKTSNTKSSILGASCAADHEIEGCCNKNSSVCFKNKQRITVTANKILVVILKIFFYSNSQLVYIAAFAL
jgi:hypothetical protein